MLTRGALLLKIGGLGVGADSGSEKEVTRIDLNLEDESEFVVWV